MIVKVKQDNGKSVKGVKAAVKPFSDRGFTLIEIIIAMFLIVTAFVGLISTTVMVINANSLSKMMSTATTLAQDKMEELQNQKFTNISAAGSPETIDTIFTR